MEYEEGQEKMSGLCEEEWKYNVTQKDVGPRGVVIEDGR